MAARHVVLDPQRALRIGNMVVWNLCPAWRDYGLLARLMQGMSTGCFRVLTFVALWSLVPRGPYAHNELQKPVPLDPLSCLDE